MCNYRLLQESPNGFAVRQPEGATRWLSSDTSRLTWTGGDATERFPAVAERQSRSEISGESDR